MKKILLFTVMCVLGLFGTLKAQNEVTIDGTVGNRVQSTESIVPINNYRDYSIAQFYYSVEEIAKSGGTLTSISFKTETGAYPTTRNIDVYLLNTEEYYFTEQKTKAVTAQDLVFSGEVEFVENSWVKIDLDNDFEYTGGNLLVCVNDKTGVDGSKSYFEVFEGNYTIDGNLYRRCLEKYASEEYDPTSPIPATQYKHVPFIQLTFASGTAEEYLEPAAPTNFKVRAVSESKINLSWDAAENAQYYEIISGTESIATNVTETSYSIKNLKLGKYNYSVRSVNGSKFSDYVDGSVELVRKDVDSIQIGQERTQTDVTDPVSSETIPFGFTMGMTSAYSWVEIPYSASLFEEGFSIDRISFDFEHGQENGPAYLDEIRIYLAEKTKENTAEWTAEKDLTLVYSDTDILIGEDKWETFEFEESFEYKAEKDLIVVVATAKTGENVWQKRSSWYFDRVDNNALYRLGEDASFAQYPTEAGTQHYARPVVQFAWEVEEVIVEAPVLKATATSDTTVLLEWNKIEGAKGYSVFQVETDGSDSLIEDYVDTVAYTVKGLTAETDYSFKVQAFNEHGDESDFSKTVNVKTLAKGGGATTPASPVVEVVITNDSTVVLTWDKVEGAESYNVYQDTVMLKEALTDTVYTITDLKVDTTYTFEVAAVNEVGESKHAKVEVVIKSKDDEEDDNENPTDSIAPTPVAIAAPDTLIAEALSTSSIKLTWSAVDSAVSYNVYVGDSVTNVTDTTYTVENLAYDSLYCFAVTAVLNDTVESEKTEECAKTLGEGIEELNVAISIYPNPVGSELFIATEVEVESVAIYDIYGRQQAVSYQPSAVSSINVSELNSGIYFVKVVTSNGEIVKRFVKK